MKVKLESFLKEICEKTTQNNQYPVLTSSKAGLFLQSDYFNKQVASKDNTGYKIIHRGQFTYRAMSDTGEFFPNMLECTDIGIVSPAYPVFEITKENEVLSDYLKYFFKSDSFQYLISAFAQGSTRTSVKFDKMKTVAINLPPMDEQGKIVTIIDRVTKTISARQQQIQKLDELVKARFVELFGNILTDRNLPLVQLSELADIGSSKRIYAYEYAEEGIPFYRSKEIRELGSGLKPSVELFITSERYNEIKNKYGVPKVGDILIAAIGATIGYSWIVNTENPFYYKDGNLIILSIKDDVNPIFLNHVMGILIDDFKNKGVAGSAQLALTIEKLEKMIVVSPDINLQNQFAVFVKQVNKSKVI